MLDIMLLVALATLNGSGTLTPFPIQIGAQVPTAGGGAPAVDPALLASGVVGVAAAFNTWRTHRNSKSITEKHAITEERTTSLATGLASVLTSLKATDVAGKDQSVLIDQLITALGTVPTIAQVLEKPISEVAPSAASEDNSKCLVEKANQNAQDSKNDIKTYYDNKPALSSDTSPDPVVKAVGEVQKQTMVTD